MKIPSESSIVSLFLVIELPSILAIGLLFLIIAFFYLLDTFVRLARKVSE